MPRSEWNIFTSRRILAITGNAVIAKAIEKNNDTLNTRVGPPETVGKYHDAKKPTKKGIIMEKKLIITIDLPCFKMEDSSTSIPTFNIINISPKNTTPFRYPDEGKSHEKKLGAILPNNVGPIIIPAIIWPIMPGILNLVNISLKIFEASNIMLSESKRLKVSYDESDIIDTR